VQEKRGRKGSALMPMSLHLILQGLGSTALRKWVVNVDNSTAKGTLHPKSLSLKYQVITLCLAVCFLKWHFSSFPQRVWFTHHDER